MTPNQPYLIRAYYEWIVDNELTPHLAVDAQMEGVEVPMEHVKDGQIILNISPTACVDMQMSNEWIMFNARFGGVSRRLIVPINAVLAIFARENGAGTMFMSQDGTETVLTEEKPEEAVSEPTKQKKPAASLQSVENNEGVSDGTSNSEQKPPRQKGKPSLKVIK